MSTEEKLIRYLDQLVEKLRQTLEPAVVDGDCSAIHQARVTTRRLKAAIDVFSSISSPPHLKPFAKSLRRLRKHLGPARDLDVMLGHVKELKSPRVKHGAAWLADELEQQRQAIHKKQSASFEVKKAMSKLDSHRELREEWIDAGDGLHCNIAQSLHLQLDSFIEYADALSNGAGNNKLDPHQLRIVGKALRYTLEMAVAGGHKLPAAVGRSFKRMQGALGLWHDYVVLSDYVLERSVKSGIGHRNPEVAIALLELAKIAVTKAAAQLAKFNTIWTGSGESLAVAIRQGFPLTAAVAASELKMDQHPPSTEPSADLPEATDAGES